MAIRCSINHGIARSARPAAAFQTGVFRWRQCVNSCRTPLTCAAQASGSDAGGQRAAAFKSRQQRRQDMATAAPEDPASSKPRRCKQAIDAGLELFQQAKYQEAIDMFNMALELPGNGAYRTTGSPREYSCPSDAEENACLYNMACCYCKLGQVDAAFTCIEAVLENGFEDVATLRGDSDLAALRGPRLEEAINKQSSLQTKLQKMFGKKDQQELVSDTNKPWILW